jgi:hypothetical protein
MQEYRSTLVKGDLIGQATQVCTAGIFQRLGAYRVLPGEILSMGFGEQEGYHDAVGRIFLILNVAGPTETLGTIRFTALTSQGRPNEVLWETRTDATDNNATDRTKQLPFPQFDLWLTENKYLALDFMADATSTVTLADSIIRMDCTRSEV